METYFMTNFLSVTNTVKFLKLLMRLKENWPPTYERRKLRMLENKVLRKALYLDLRNRRRENIFVYTENNLIICTPQRIYITGRSNKERLHEQICKSKDRVTINMKLCPENIKQ
jgi:hypothetical protein